jgi:hypothetical protein
LDNFGKFCDEIKLLYARARGSKPEKQWHPAGDYPATIKLKRE